MALIGVVLVRLGVLALTGPLPIAVALLAAAAIHFGGVNSSLVLLGAALLLLWSGCSLQPLQKQPLPDFGYSTLLTRATKSGLTGASLVLPIDAARVIETPHEFSLSLAGRELRFFDTPGHARHHVCIQDTRSGHVFTGDTFGLSYRELDDALLHLRLNELDIGTLVFKSEGDPAKAVEGPDAPVVDGHHLGGTVEAGLLIERQLGRDRPSLSIGVPRGSRLLLRKMTADGIALLPLTAAMSVHQFH